jgi:hypothetical protein
MNDRKKAIKGKKFHIQGEDENRSLVLTECTDRESGIIVKLERAKPGVPVKLGHELCQMSFDKSGHVELDMLDVPGSGDEDDGDDGDGDGGYDGEGSGPAMVSSKEYRAGWDRIFSSKAN